MTPLEVFFEQNLWVLVVAMIWVLPWKGYALWSAAKLGHKWWFIILLVVNTLAILDIIYIFAVAKRVGKKFAIPVRVVGETRKNQDAPSENN